MGASAGPVSNAAWCSHEFDPQSTWLSVTSQAVHQSFRTSSAQRNVAKRISKFARFCNGTATRGLTCEFLESGTRFRVPTLLNQMNYSGASAEVGVWIGDYSSALLKRWQLGALHFGVDPYQAYKTGCDAEGTAQWHCVKAQGVFDVHFNQTKQRLARDAPGRYVPMRVKSLDAVQILDPKMRFDFVYLDGRHDRLGFEEDLRAWLPRVCPGGILSGHDYTDAQVAAGLSSVFLEQQPTVAYITSEHPASFILFRPPSGK